MKFGKPHVAVALLLATHHGQFNAKPSRHIAKCDALMLPDFSDAVKRLGFDPTIVLTIWKAVGI